MTRHLLGPAGWRGKEVPGLPLFADPELCSLEGEKEVGPGCPGPGRLPGAQSRPSSSLGRSNQACKGPARGVSLAGHGLGVDGCGGTI